MRRAAAAKAILFILGTPDFKSHVRLVACRNGNSRRSDHPEMGRPCCHFQSRKVVNRTVRFDLEIARKAERPYSYRLISIGYGEHRSRHRSDRTCQRSPWRHEPSTLIEPNGSVLSLAWAGKWPGGRRDRVGSHRETAFALRADRYYRLP